MSFGCGKVLEAVWVEVENLGGDETGGVSRANVGPKLSPKKNSWRIVGNFFEAALSASSPYSSQSCPT